MKTMPTTTFIGTTHGASGMPCWYGTGLIDGLQVNAEVVGVYSTSLGVGASPYLANANLVSPVSACCIFDYGDYAGKTSVQEDERLARLPASVKRLATLLDRPTQTPVLTYEGVFAESTFELKASEVSTLIRVVDSADDELQTAHAVMSAADGEIVSRRWFGTWGAVALSAALQGSLTRKGLLDLLREARRRHRRERVRLRRPASFVRRLRGQLDRLANFVAPNAPPYGVLLHDIVAGVAAP